MEHPLPPPLPPQSRFLQRIADKVRVTANDGGPTPVVVFTIDGVLLDNRSRTRQILMDFGQERCTDPEVKKKLENSDELQIRKLLSQTLAELDIEQHELLAKVGHYWRERFESEEYLELDAPLPGAAAFARELHDLGATIVYVSERVIPSMLLGTVRSLRDHDFPIAEPAVQLIMKPDPTLGDEAFRRAVLPDILSAGDVIAVFEADPAMAIMAEQTFTHADVAVVETWGLQFDEALVGIQDFRHEYVD